MIRPAKPASQGLLRFGQMVGVVGRVPTRKHGGINRQQGDEEIREAGTGISLSSGEDGWANAGRQPLPPRRRSDQTDV
jgi:hypothetical protein